METVSWMILVFSFVVCLLGLLYMYFAVKFMYWKSRGVPYLEPTFPMGNTPDVTLFRKTFGLVMADLYKELDGYKFGGFYQTSIPLLLIRDPDLIRDVLVKNFHNFHDHGVAFDEKVDPISGNLFFLQGSRWKELREKVSPTFTSSKLKNMFQTFVDCGQEFKEFLDTPASRSEILEVKEVLAKFSTDIIASCAFGITCNCLKNPDAEFRKWGRKMFQPSVTQICRGLLYFIAPSIAIALKVTQNPPDVANFFRKVVKETVEYRENNNVKRNDFMQLLIQLKNKGTLDVDNSSQQQNGSHKTLTLDELTAQAFVFFFAGFETSSTAMTFALYELAVNFNIQERLREEVDKVLEKYGGNITYEAIQDMGYLDKVVSETLRKYPPSPHILRECTKDYKIPGTDVIIEKGTRAVIPTIALHYDPQYYPEPRKFDPERFSDEVKSKRHHYTYLPFGEGPRICIGMRFALMQIKVGLASIMSKYEFHVCEKTPIPLLMEPKSFILSPKGGMWLRIRNRSRKSK